MSSSCNKNLSSRCIFAIAHISLVSHKHTADKVSRWRKAYVSADPLGGSSALHPLSSQCIITGLVEYKVLPRRCNRVMEAGAKALCFEKAPR